MKDFDPIKLTQDKISVFNQREIEKHKQLFSRTQLHKGHTMWEINCTSGEVKEAKYSDEKIVFVPNIDLITGTTIGTVPKTTKDIISKENCIYVGALNKNSAKKKFLQYLMKNAKI